MGIAPRARPVRILILTVGLLGLLYGASYLRQVTPPPEPPPPLAVPGSDIEVQVLNESGVARLAQRLTRYLRERGFDVVELGNGNRVGLEHTEVVVRGDDITKGARVAEAINCEFVRAEAAPQLQVDVTVLIGKDIEELVTLPD